MKWELIQPTFFSARRTYKIGPLTPELNQKTHTKIAGYHAALDKIGSSYFIKKTTMILLW
jgi:hypothetical protein